MKQSGFTLIEILVVMFIIAIVFTSTTVMLSQSQLTEKNNQVSAQKLQSLFESLQTDAIIQGMPHRLLITKNQFVLQRYVYHAVESTWQSANLDARMPLGKIQLQSEIANQIRFTPDGFITPFQLTISANNNRTMVHCQLELGSPKCVAS